jgi:hypothetical protein
MNWYLFTAAVIAFLVGLIHSVLGERLIFSRLRQGSVVPTNGGTLLDERHVRILWASWHVVTVLGWCLAAVLLWLSRTATSSNLPWFLGLAVIFAMLFSSALVFIGTKAKHPGWIGLLVVAIFVWFGRFI